MRHSYHGFSFNKHILSTSYRLHDVSFQTRVLVTHRLSVLDRCDVVYVLKDGRISEQGSYRELVARKGAFADFLIQHLKEKEIDEIPEEDLNVMEEIIEEGSAPPQLIR